VHVKVEFPYLFKEYAGELDQSNSIDDFEKF